MHYTHNMAFIYIMPTHQAFQVHSSLASTTVRLFPKPKGRRVDGHHSLFAFLLFLFVLFWSPPFLLHLNCESPELTISDRHREAPFLKTICYSERRKIGGFRGETFEHAPKILNEEKLYFWCRPRRILDTTKRAGSRILQFLAAPYIRNKSHHTY